MLETAKKEGYAYPAVNVTTIEVINGALHAVFFAAHDADFNFKDDAQFGAFLQQFPG